MTLKPLPNTCLAAVVAYYHFSDGRRLDSVLGYSYKYSLSLTAFVYQDGQRLG